MELAMFKFLMTKRRGAPPRAGTGETICGWCAAIVAVAPLCDVVSGSCRWDLIMLGSDSSHLLSQEPHSVGIL
jgi:hypothetical protein